MQKKKSSRVARKTPAVKNAKTPTTQNGLGDAFGYNGGGLPGAGNRFTPAVSGVDTTFEYLRNYFISNMRQPLSEAYAEIGLVQTVVDVPVDDGLRGGIDITSKQLDEDQIEELKISIDREDDLNTAGQALKWNRLFGGAGILILVGDQDPESVLDVEAIGPDTPLEFRSVDMWELYDNQRILDTEQRLEPAGSESEHYTFYGHKVHRSRVMILKGIKAPSFIRPRLRGWGLSVCEVLIRSINQYLKSSGLMFECLDEFKVDIYKIKNLMTTLLAPDGGTKVAERIRMANWQKDYQNAIVMDSEDDWDHKQISFAGLAESMEGIRMQVASDMRMPITKLFGTSVSGGIGNTDQNDMENYNSMVESQIRSAIKYDLLRIVEIKCQKLFGFIPDDIRISFQPLRVLSATDEEVVKSSKFARVLQARQAGEISSKEFKEACNRDSLLEIQLDPNVDTLEIEGELMDDDEPEQVEPKKDMKALEAKEAE